MKKFWFRRAILFFFIFIAAVLVFGTVVMLLWNAILPAVLGVKAITFYQALGILVLSKILFGGFAKGRGWHAQRHAWKEKWRAKWEGMTPEEREKFRAEWRKRCGGRWHWDENTVSGKEKESE
ncbi:MAG TPA: hypothetical protein VG847_13875 [Chitinophagaceae bacterium]|nr:hypothetical protein [Chitinophagaceae bacterium]